MADGKVIIDATIDDKGIDSGSQKIESKLSKLGKGAGSIASSVGKGVVTAVGVASTAVVGFGISSLKAGGEFNASMSNVQAISGATGKELESMRDMAKDLGSTTVFSASEAADAMGELALMGFDTNEVLGATPGVLDLASAAGMGLQESAGLVAGTLNQFQMEAKDAGKAADIFAKAQASSGTTASEMGEAMKYAGGAANSFNMDLEQTSAVLGVFADSNIKGSQAGTTFVAMLDDMKKNAEDGAIAIGDTSVAIVDANGDFRDAGSIMADVEKATEGMTSAQKDAALSNIFGQQSMKGVNAMLAKGEEGYKELEKAIYDSNGASKEMSEIMTDNLPGDISAMKSALEGLQIALHENLDAPARQVVQSVTGYFAKLSETMQTDMSKVPQVIGEIMVDIITKIGEALPGIIQAGTDIIVSLIDGLIAQQENATSSMGAIISAVVEAIITIVPKFLELGIIIIGRMIEGFVNNMPNIIAKMNEILSKLVQGIADKLPNFLSKAMEIIGKMIEGFIKQLPNIVSTMATLLTTLITAIANSLPTFLAKGVEIVGRIVVGLVKSIPQVLSAGGDIIAGLIRGISAMIGGVLGAIGNITKGIISKVRGVSLASIGRNMIAGLIGGIRSMLSSVKQAVSDVVLAPVNWVKGKLGIHSPSRVFRDEIGEMLPAGLVLGVEDGIDDVKGTTDKLVDASIPDTRQIIPEVAQYQHARNMPSTTNNTNISIDTNTIEMLLNIIAGNTEAFKDKRFISKELAPFISNELAYQGRRG